MQETARLPAACRKAPHKAAFMFTQLDIYTCVCVNLFVKYEESSKLGEPHLSYFTCIRKLFKLLYTVWFQFHQQAYSIHPPLLSILILSDMLLAGFLVTSSSWSSAANFKELFILDTVNFIQQLKIVTRLPSFSNLCLWGQQNRGGWKGMILKNMENICSPPLPWNYCLTVQHTSWVHKEISSGPCHLYGWRSFNSQLMSWTISMLPMTSPSQLIIQLLTYVLNFNNHCISWK